MVRAATDADVDAMVDLVANQEFTRPLTPDQLRVLFTQEWREPRANYGFVVARGSGIVGLTGCLYSPTRTLGPVRTSTVNSGMLFVLPRYRARRTSDGVVRYGVELARAVASMGRPVFIFSARGPNNVVPAILSEVGFEEISAAERYFAPGAHVATLLRPAGRISNALADSTADLDPHERQIVQDHAGHGCRFFAIHDRDQRCFVVTRRRLHKGGRLWPKVALARVRTRPFPVTDVLYMSEPDVARESWGRFVVHACRLDRTVGVTCSHSFFSGAPPAGTDIPQASYAANRTMPVRYVDKLYSELLLLP